MNMLPKQLIGDEPVVGLTMATPELEAEAAALAPLSNHMHTIGVHEKGTTDYDFEGLLKEFSAVGYDGYFNVEFVADDLPYEDSVRADHEFLRSLLDC